MGKVIKKIKNLCVDGGKLVVAAICLVLGLGLMLGTLSQIFNPVENYQAIKDLPSYDLKDVESNSRDKHDALLAVYMKDRLTKKWTFDCTAFAISDKLALTAGHCVVEELTERMIKEDFLIKDKDMKEIGTARPAAVNVRADVAVLVGDFSKVNKLRVSLEGFYGSRGPFVACGFPWGQSQPVQLPFTPKTNYYFLIKGYGQLYPGMSGGPVIDMTNLFVVGINDQADDGFVAVVPTIGITGALNLQVKDP